MSPPSPIGLCRADSGQQQIAVNNTEIAGTLYMREYAHDPNAKETQHGEF
jgi:hypothetical protein